MHNSKQTAALILAAGKGTRMHSPRAKVMQTLLGESMLAHVNRALHPLFGGAVWAVIGHDAAFVREAFKAEPLLFVEQEQQLGTGHAVLTAFPALKSAGCERVLVINGDTPLVSPELIEHFVRQSQGAEVAFASLTLEDAAHFGRVVRHQGQVQAIIEAKDFCENTHGPASGEINAGLYLFSMAFLQDTLPRLTTCNANAEMYLTDLVALGVQGGLKVVAVDCGQNSSLLGINTPAELAQAESELQKNIVTRHLQAGVIMHSPELIRIGAAVKLEPGVELFGPCEVYGASHISKGALVRSHCVILDSVIEGAQVREFCHLEKAHVQPGSIVGPYARLRPGADIAEEAHVGNFVEIKNAKLGPGAKANHLSYIGDAVVGAKANIGAGVITCNYDGVNKHTTVIGQGAFIGSNASLVAPVQIGENATIGAGSTISKNVPADNLSLTRAVQKILPWKKRTRS